MAGEFGKALRERRTAMDLSRSRLAAATGATAAAVGRWERGEGVPTPAQFAALPDLLRLSPAETEIWRALLDPGRVAAAGPGAGDPPAPPSGGEPVPVVRRLPTVQQPDPPPPAGGRPPVLLPDEERSLRETRRFEGLLSRGNTGAIFPIPAGPGRVYTYGDGRPTYEADRWRYRVRTVLLLVVLGVMAGLLVWAMGELGDGLSAIVDLFRSEPAPTVVGTLFRTPLS